MLLKTILNIREGKNIEMQNLQIKLENSSKKELMEKINELKEDFLKEYLKLKSTLSDSQTVIYTKNAEIAHLSETVISQETLITELRITLQELKNKENQQIQEKPKKLQESFYPKHQVSMYKDIIDQLKSEINNLRVALQKVKDENQKLKKSLNENEPKSNPMEEIEKLRQEKEEVQKEFERFKFQVNKEVELREMLNDRHLQSISVLQDEIKAIRVAGHTPTAGLRHGIKLIENHEEPQSRLTLDKPKARSLPKYSAHLSKINSHYSYKEYKAFHPESGPSVAPLRGLCKPPKLEGLPKRGSVLCCTSEVNSKFFKSSVLITSKDHR
jgi:chromosome segregation ATPase